ncbi:hypothetical protein GQ600_16320 [Phytophthora cactorum]|nr:hypothetical protein GQ600_27969 [Phytophthora cactorum]KAF1793275.1 hypothetical protein GQ600_16320 [Phytophthora cactorum]
MTEAALAGPTVSLMTRRRASAPPAQPADAVAASSSEAKQRSKSSGSAANSENLARIAMQHAAAKQKQRTAPQPFIRITPRIYVDIRTSAATASER